MVNVLHVAQPVEAGVAAYLAAAAADQLARGWDVTVACPPDGWLSARLAAAGVRHVPWEAQRAPGLSMAGEVRRLGGILDRIGPDVLHLHSSKAGMAGRLAARGRVPTLFQPHGWSWLAARPPMAGSILAWERLAARWTDVFVCVGEGEAAHGRDRGVTGRYAVVPNGVDLLCFKPADDTDRRAAREALGIPYETPLAVCVGRVTRQKGQDVLLRAWHLVRSGHPAARLAVVGGGDLLESLRATAPADVFFTGHADDPGPWYAAADLVVLPSRWEGLPLTLCEALAVGRSVVGSDIPGISDVLPADSGSLVPVGDPAALAAAIAHRLGDRDITEAEGMAAARYAAGNADVRRTFDQLAGVTEQVARSRR